MKAFFSSIFIAIYYKSFILNFLERTRRLHRLRL